MTGRVAALGVSPRREEDRDVHRPRSVLSAAVRLGVTGSYEAQRLQAECAAWSATVQARCHDAGPDDLAQTAPIIDILQGAHDRLYSRLFQS